MKKIIVLISIISFSITACDNIPDNEFMIKGKVKGMASGKVYLTKRMDRDFVTVDSTHIHNGKFTFKSEIVLPEMYYLSLEGKEDYYPLFMETGSVKVNLLADSLSGSHSSGSKTQYIYDSYLEGTKIYHDREKELYTLYREAKSNNDTALMNNLDKQWEELDTEKQKFTKSFIQKHNASVVSPYVVQRELIYYLELEELEEIVNSFDISISESKYTQVLYDRIKVLRTVAIGQPAPEISLKDTNDVLFNLSSLQGKYVLVDFWASWCGPCRKENPNVVKLYHKYHKAGFDILGVSFDSNRAAWIQAINDDRLAWNHISDLKGWQSAAASLYGVNSIPHTVLLDQEGIIIARNLHSDDLKKKLLEIFGF